MHGVKDHSELIEIMPIMKEQNYNVKSFDIAKMETEGVITLIFERYEEAQKFAQILEERKGYKC